MTERKNYRKVPFSEVKPSGFFKEREEGSWYLKTSKSECAYSSCGETIINRFDANEPVLVEQ